MKNESIIEKEVYIRKQIREMMHMISSRVPREQGFGWKIQKFHELLHIPTALTQFGSPTNYNAGPGECGLKSWAKQPARKALKWESKNFLRSVAIQIHLSNSLSKMNMAVEPINDQIQSSISETKVSETNKLKLKTSKLPSYFVNFKAYTAWASCSDYTTTLGM